MELEYVTPSPVAIPERWKDRIEQGLENFNDIRIALVGVCEYRGNFLNAGCETAPDVLRRELYALQHFPDVRIADVGNIVMGATYRDTLFAMEATVHRLLEHKIIPVILGGDKTLIAAQERACHSLYFPYLNVLHVDEHFRLTDNGESDADPENYLARMIAREPSLIFNLIQLGYQEYFTDVDDLVLAEQMGFESYRLGRVREDIRETEPVVRDGDLMAFNVSALDGQAGIGYGRPTPNGFTAEEACALVRYAGLSDRLSSIGFYGYNPSADLRGRTAQVLAQAIWYFIRGVAHRKNDYPVLDERAFNKYIVTSREIGQDITFLKSKKSDRWWIRLPDEHLKYQTHQLFPCSYKDYQMALKEEVPERWWRAYNRML